MGKTAIIFPGIGYHKDKPLLYYSRCLAKEAGYNVEFVDFSGIAWEKGDLRDTVKMNEFFKLAMQCAEDKLSGKAVTADDELLFISKSIGTAVAARYAKEKHLNVKQVYFSPIVPFGIYAQDYGMAFYGDNDPLADYREIEEICIDKKIESHRIEGGNHSLETGDTEQDLKNLAWMMGLVKTFI